MKVTHWVIAVASLALPAFTFTGTASAQLSSNGGPIQIEADMLDVLNTLNQAVYVGNVDAVQGSTRLRTEKMTLIFGEGGPAEPGRPISAGPLKQLIAEGEVFYITPAEKVKGDRAVYDREADTIVMTGNITVTNDDGVIVGDRLIIEIAEERFTMSSLSDGRERVRSVIDASGQSLTGVVADTGDNP